MQGEYGIIANIVETDRFVRTGSKSWLVGGTGGEGWYRFVWVVRTRSGQLTKKWLPTKRLGNFRAAWIPDHIREINDGYIYISGTRDEMEAVAVRMSLFAEDLRNNTSTPKSDL